MRLYNPEGGWSKEFKDQVYGLFRGTCQEMDLKLVFDSEIEEVVRRVVEEWATLYPSKMVDVHRPTKSKVDWMPGFRDDVYTCVKTLAKEMGYGPTSGTHIDLEQSCHLIQAWIDMHPGIEQCISHRCERHRHVGPLNASTIDGAECGACILLTARTAEQLLSQERRDHETLKHHQVSEPAG